MRFSAALILPFVLITGCGSDVQRGKLHGTITYQGKPVTFGTLIFIGHDNMTYLADLDKAGHYSVDRVPFGKLTVSLQQTPPRPAPKTDPTAAKAKIGMSETKDAKRQEIVPEEPKHFGVIVPARYGDPLKSQLSLEMNKGDQEWSVDLN